MFALSRDCRPIEFILAVPEPRSGYFLLLGQKKVPKEKAAPDGASTRLRFSACAIRGPDRKPLDPRLRGWLLLNPPRANRVPELTLREFANRCLSPSGELFAAGEFGSR